MSQDAAVLKDNIVSLLSSQGPTLPIMISKGIGSSSLFTAAFLSELFEEKRIRMSEMRVGSSPVYFLDGQEPLLERFANNLKSKEKEAYAMLKEKKFLLDSEQNPAIRVALREIRDFAIPISSSEGLFWRFVAVPESEFRVKEKPKPALVLETPKEKTVEPEVTKPKVQKVPKAKKKKQKIVSMAKSHIFFEKVKLVLSERNISITEVKYIGSNEVVLIIKDPTETALIAYNKRKITESDIIRAAKRASDLNLPFKIYSQGEVLKKTKSLIDALKNLSGLEVLK